MSHAAPPSDFRARLRVRTLGNYLDGRTLPRTDTIAALVTAGIDANRLLSAEGSPQIQPRRNDHAGAREGLDVKRAILDLITALHSFADSVPAPHHD